MKAYKLKSLLALFSCFLASTSWAQDWYEIEILIFEHRSNQYESFNDPETWPSDLTLEWPSPLLELEEPLDEALSSEDDEDTSPEVPAPFQILPIEQQRLSNANYAMRVRDGYNLLWHKSWKAPLLPEEEAPWILIQAEELADEHYRLEGALRIHLGRYLHVHSDLWLTELLPVDSEEQTEFHWSQLPAPKTPQWPCIFIDESWPNLARELPSDYFEKPAPDEWYFPFGCTLTERDETLDEESVNLPVWLPLEPTATEPAFAQNSDSPFAVNSPLSTAGERTNFQEDSENINALNRPNNSADIGSRNINAVFTTGEDGSDLSAAPIRETGIGMNELDGENYDNNDDKEENAWQRSLYPVKEIVHIQSQRRMRSEELHYIDHPRVGILAIIHPVEQPVVEAEPIKYISAPLPSLNTPSAPTDTNTDSSTTVTE